LIPAEQTEDGIPKLAIPIKVRGNVIGVIQANKPSDTPIWTTDEQTMLEAIVEQIGLSLDSARLYEETQLRAETERIIGESSARMRATLDIETVLQTAARELRAALDLAEVEIRMGTQTTEGSEHTPSAPATKQDQA
jgi:GAF domain-containing protein